MTRDMKEAFGRSDDSQRLKIIQQLIDQQLKVVKTSPDINTIRYAQGQLTVLEYILDALG